MKKNTHPKALWILSLIYSLYAISYGVLFANLLLYSDHSPIINFSENHAFQFFAAFSSLTFILPFFGGYICDKHGFMKVAKTGFLLSILGFICLAMNNSKMIFILGIGFCLSGNAFIMPAIWSMVGLSYEKKDGAQEAGTTIFYLLFNIGFLISFLLSSLIAQIFSYNIMFYLFSLGSLSAFFVLIAFEKNIPNLPVINNRNSSFIAVIFLVFILTLLLLSFLILNNIIMWGLTIFAFIYLYILSKKAKYQDEKNSIHAFMFLSLLGIVGLTIYNSEFGLLPEFSSHAIDLSIHSYQLPAQIITSLDPLFCIILGMIFSSLWIYLSKKNMNPGLASKLSLGIILPALGYLLLVIALHIAPGNKLNLIWLLPIFILFVAGELLVIPTGIAMATRLAPKDKEGIFMGIWNLMQGFSALITGYIAYFTVVHPEHNQWQINSQYSHVFMTTGMLILSMGLIAWLASHKVNKLLCK